MLLRTASRRVHRTPIASWLSGQLQQQRADLSSTPLDERQLQLEEKKLAEAAAQREHEAVQRKHEAAQRKHEAAQRKHEAAEAAAQRKHEAAEAAAQRKHEEEKLATQRELEEKKLVETAAQRELVEKKLVETAAQRELEEKKLATQREHKERRLARHAETKCFQLTVTNADGMRTDLPEMRLRRDEWDSFQKYTTRGPLYVLSDTGQLERVVNGFDGLVEGQAYIARPEQTLGSRLSELESSLRNRVSADEEALCEQMLAMMSPCIDGLAKAPDARRLYRWQDAGQLERFGTLVRLGLDATAAERAELTRLKTLFEDADRVQRITAMEFDAVLLNSHAAVVCEAKSSLTSEQLTKFDDKINRVLVRAAKDVVYRVYQGMSVLPVLLANHFVESEAELHRTARELGILLISRNGIEYGPRLPCNGKSDCDLYRSLLRSPTQ